MAEQTSGVLAGLSNELAAAVEKAAASTVQVDARRRQGASGIIWQADGVIVTADHTLERDEDITVRLADGRKLAATIAGRDPGTDIAVLKVEATDLPAAERGTTPKVGNLILLVGRPNGDASATIGVASAITGPARTWRGGTLEGIIRTDAIMLPGFSGGPLSDAGGKVLGMTTSQLGQPAGLALTVETVDRVVKAILSGGRLRRGYLGITSQPVQIPSGLRTAANLSQETGLLVVGVVADGPAEKGGVMLGDLLVGLAEQAVRDTEDLQVVLTPDSVGKEIAAKVLRGGALQEVKITVGERP